MNRIELQKKLLNALLERGGCRWTDEKELSEKIAWASPFIIRFSTLPLVMEVLLDPARIEEIDQKTIKEDFKRLYKTTDDLKIICRLVKLKYCAQIIINDIYRMSGIEELFRLQSTVADTIVSFLLNEISKERCEGTILAMGKLGSYELNFSSDIDLIFIADSQYGSDRYVNFSKISKKLINYLTQTTELGHCYRVDVDLRPGSKQTPLCTTIEASESYYQAFGTIFDRMALARSRYLAGKREIAEEFYRTLKEFIFPKNISPEAVNESYLITERFRKYNIKNDDTIDLKFDRGMIRDIEMFTYMISVVFGSRIPHLKGSVTNILKWAYKHGVVDAETYNILHDAYILYRHTEQRLQMYENRQTFSLNEKSCPPSVYDIVGTKDFKKIKKLLIELSSEVWRCITKILSPRMSKLKPLFSETKDPVNLLQKILKKETSVVWLNKNIQAPSGIFHKNSPLANTIGLRFYNLLIDTIHPDETAEMILRLFFILRRYPSYFDMLVERPKFLSRLIKIADLLGPTSYVIINQPEIIDILSSISEEEILPQERWLKSTVKSILGLSDPETRLERLRLLKNEMDIRSNLGIAGSKITFDQYFEFQTTLADIILSAVLDCVFIDLKIETKDKRPFFLGALGSYGAKELRSGSDLDLLLINREGSGDVIKIAKRFLSYIRTYMRGGRLYEIDTRLRPSGRFGLLVTSLDALLEYHKRHLDAWERIYMLKFRLPHESQELEQKVLEITYNSIKQDGDIHRYIKSIKELVTRLSKNLAKENNYRYNIKFGSGGFIFLDFLAAYFIIEMIFNNKLPTRGIMNTFKKAQELGMVRGSEFQILKEAFYTYNMLFLQNRYHKKSDSDIINNEPLGRHILEHAGHSIESFIDLRNEVRSIFERILK